MVLKDFRTFGSFEDKRGQVTIFIIVAVLIVISIVAFFIFRNSISISDNVPTFAEPVYTHFLSCIDDEAKQGIDLIETRGGYITPPKFEPGSSYMPFSSELNFLGINIPYWYYISGNNLERENVPSQQLIEEQLSKFIEENIGKCDFSSFTPDGFEVGLLNPKVSTLIKDKSVDFSLKVDFNVSRNNESVLIRSHSRNVKSSLGSLYNSALQVYDYEQKTLFLEEYGVDVLRLYAPVDGVEVTCTPKVWEAESVFDKVRSAIEANTLAIKSKNNNFDLKNNNQKYFVVDLPVDQEVRFLNFQNWPSTFDVEPSEGDILISKPVGNQNGLGALGFCYVPYHFVYDARYSTLIQLVEGDETFQFPVAVIIKGNLPRNAAPGSALETQKPPICDYKNTPFEINVFDKRFNSLDANITYSCFGVSCDVGETVSGTLQTSLPQCVNGYINVRSEGYEEVNYLQSTVQPGQADIILDKLYPLDVELFLDSKVYNGNAIVTFTKDGSSKTVIYPDHRNVELTEGQYSIEVQAFRNSTLRLPEINKQECTKVPSSGFGAILGLEKEQCFDVKIPSQVISGALFGGGKQNSFILESDLENSRKIKISGTVLPSPTSIEQIQENYVLFDSQKLIVGFE